MAGWWWPRNQSVAKAPPPFVLDFAPSFVDAQKKLCAPTDSFVGRGQGVETVLVTDGWRLAAGHRIAGTGAKHKGAALVC